MRNLSAVRAKERRQKLMKMLLVAALIAAGLDFAPVGWSSRAAYADPPPWAPAWGYRGKHKKKHGHHDDDDDREYIEVRPSPTRVEPYGIGAGTCHRELVGAVVGGAAGGLAGSQVGKGKGQLAAVAGGAIIGLIVGGMVGRAMDQADQNCVGQVLEHAPDQRPVVWTNGANQDRYAVVPQRTYRMPDNRYCRDYLTTATIGGREQRVSGTACRNPDGSWQLMN